MYFYKVLTPISTTSVFEVPAIRVNTTKSTYTFTSVFLFHKLEIYQTHKLISYSILSAFLYIYWQFKKIIQYRYMSMYHLCPTNRTSSPQQTVKTQIRLLLKDSALVREHFRICPSLHQAHTFCSNKYKLSQKSLPHRKQLILMNNMYRHILPFIHFLGCQDVETKF